MNKMYEVLLHLEVTTVTLVVLALAAIIVVGIGVAMSVERYRYEPLYTYKLTVVTYDSDNVWKEFKAPEGKGWEILTVTQKPNSLDVIVLWQRDKRRVMVDALEPIEASEVL